MEQKVIFYYDNTLLYHPNIFMGALLAAIIVVVIVVCVFAFFLVMYSIALMVLFKNRKKKNRDMKLQFLYRVYRNVNHKISKIEKRVKKYLLVIKKELFLPE